MLPHWMEVTGQSITFSQMQSLKDWPQSLHRCWLSSFLAWLSMIIIMTTHNYWCFLCENNFSSEQPAKECPSCHEQAFEEASESTNPAQFQVYQDQRPQPSVVRIQPLFFQQNSSGMQMQELQNFGQAIFNNLPVLMGNVSNIMQSMLQSLYRSGQEYHPATREEISRLERVSRVSECAICQVEQLPNTNGFKLPCNHSFHQDCIMPWFQRANTCPNCRSPI